VSIFFSNNSMLATPLSVHKYQLYCLCFLLLCVLVKFEWVQRPYLSDTVSLIRMCAVCLFCHFCEHSGSHGMYWQTQTFGATKLCCAWGSYKNQHYKLCGIIQGASLYKFILGVTFVPP